MTKFKIEVEVDGDNQTIFVRDSAGNVRELHGVIVSGADLAGSSWYLFAFGSPEDVGYSLARGYRECRGGEIGPPNDAYYRRVFDRQAEWIASYHGWDRGVPVEAEEVLSRWEHEDKIDKAINQGKRLNEKGNLKSIPGSGKGDNGDSN